VNEFNDEPLHCWRNKSAVAIVLTGTAADDPANGTQRGGDAGAAIDPHSSMCVFLKVEISFDTNWQFNRGVRPRQSRVRGFYRDAHIRPIITAAGTTSTIRRTAAQPCSQLPRFVLTRHDALSMDLNHHVGQEEGPDRGSAKDIRRGLRFQPNVCV